MQSQNPIVVSVDSAVPDWAPGGARDDPYAASCVKGGVDEEVASGKRPAVRRRLSLDECVAEVRAGDVTILSRAIALVESQRPDHQILAQQLLTRVLPHAGHSVRVGTSGVPAAKVARKVFTVFFGDASPP